MWITLLIFSEAVNEVFVSENGVVSCLTSNLKFDVFRDYWFNVRRTIWDFPLLLFSTLVG